MSLELRPLTGDIPVLCLSFAMSPSLESSEVSVSYRFIDPDGTVEDERARIKIRNPHGCKDAAEWVKAVLGEVLLSM